jgi:hypothetical protein
MYNSKEIKNVYNILITTVHRKRSLDRTVQKYSGSVQMADLHHGSYKLSGSMCLHACQATDYRLYQKHPVS